MRTLPQNQILLEANSEKIPNSELLNDNFDKMAVSKLEMMSEKYINISLSFGNSFLVLEVQLRKVQFLGFLEMIF